MAEGSNGKLCFHGEPSDMFARVTHFIPFSDEYLMFISNSGEKEEVFKFDVFCERYECSIVNGHAETSSVYVGTKGQNEGKVVFDLYFNDNFTAEYVDVKFFYDQQNCSLPRIYYQGK